MPNFYAQLNDSNICTTVSELSGEIIDIKLIKLDKYDASLLGKKYNGGIFSDVIKAPVIIRTILGWALDERFTLAESAAIEASTNSYVKALNRRLSRKPFINLDAAMVSEGLDLLTTLGIIKVGRKAELLVDGTHEETRS